MGFECIEPYISDEETDKAKKPFPPGPKPPPQECWDRFWKDIVCDKGGKINKRLVMNELSDYYFAMNEVPKVYMHVTGGLLSKCNYHASGVQHAADEHYRKVYRDNLSDFIKDMVANGYIQEEYVAVLEKEIDSYI